MERSTLNALRRCASPGRGGHEPARLAAEKVYACRESVSELFNVGDPARVVFTQNATHALNIAIFSLAEAGDRVLISGFEHNSVTRPLYETKADIDICGRKLFDTKAVLDDFERKIPFSKLVVCTHVSNVFGFILPIYEIAEMCGAYSVPLIVDASQSAGILDVDFLMLNASFVAMPGHKSLFGPQGTGILLCRDSARPLLYGGSGSESRLKTMPDYLPERLEAGTANVCGIAGLNAGIDFVRSKGTKRISGYEKHLSALMCSRLRDVKQIRLYESEGGNQSGVISFAPKRGDSEDFAERLSERGICVRAGLHCAPTAHESAGTAENGTVRVSFSPFNSEGEVLRAADEIKFIAQNY